MSDVQTRVLRGLRNPKVVNGIGLALVALVVLWLVVNFVKAPPEFVNVGLDRAHAGLDLRCRRARLHARLRDSPADQLRPRRRVRAVGARRQHDASLSILGPRRATRATLVVVGGLVVTLAVTMPLFAVVNATIERVAYRPLRNAPRLAPLITAVGMSFIVSNISLALYGVDYESGSDLIPQGAAFTIGDDPLHLEARLRARDHRAPRSSRSAGSSARRGRGRRCARSRRTPRRRR